MSPAALQRQLEREAIERALLEMEHMPRRIACELILLRRVHQACVKRTSRGLLDWRAIWRALDRIPAPEEIERWDEIVHAAEQLLDATNEEAQA